MPVGVICDVLAVALGGAAGALGGARLSGHSKEKLNLIFGLCSMGIGVCSIVLMENLPAVVLALILGTSLGMAAGLGRRIGRVGAGLAARFPGGAQAADQGLMVTAIVLFCFSGTGIYGAIVSGMSGDHSILMAKAILDAFTAAIFACSLGLSVCAIAIPQGIVFLALFFCARLIFPLTTPVMVDDFKACGGLIMLATGLRMAGVRDFPIADMIPAMLLVWPASWLWTAWVLPML